MEPATQQDFCKETDSRGLGKTERIALTSVSVSLLTFYSSRPLLVGFLSRYSDILSSSLRSGILRFICFQLSGQFCKYDKDSCIKSVKFPSQHFHISLFRLVMNHRLTVALFLHLYSCGFSRVPLLHWSIQFLFEFNTKEQVAFPDQLSKMTFLPVILR